MSSNTTTTPYANFTSALYQTTGQTPNENGMVCCPAHEDNNPSLSVSEGDDGRVLLKCFAGCSAESVCAAVGRELKDLMPTSDNYSSNGFTSKPAKKEQQVFPTAKAALQSLEKLMGKHSARWTYHDINNKPIGLIVRWDKSDGKTFRPIAFNGNGWVIGAMPEPRPLYHLPELAKVNRVYVTEGEKACDAACSIGLVATCSAGGSGAARQTDWQALAGKEIIILPDNDEPGNKYADDVCDMLLQLEPPPTIKIVTLPRLPEKGDIVDWLDELDSKDSDELKQAIKQMANAAEPIEPVDFKSSSGKGKVMKEQNRNAVADIVCMSDIEPTELCWLWSGKIPLGKLTLLAGDPGLGKSFVTLDITSTISNGGLFPDGASCQQGSVILLSAEDDPSDTIRPRLDDMGADVSQIHIMQGVKSESKKEDGKRHFSLADDLPKLAQVVQEIGNVRLVVIDPISAYSGKVDSHKNADIRGLLTPLANFAATYQIAVLAVTHLNKGSSGKALYRAMGSLAYIAAARAGWLIAEDRQDSERRLMLPVKMNLCQEPSGLAYAIKDGKVCWEPEPVNIDCDDALGEPGGKKPSRREEAGEWLRERLADGGVSSKDILEEAKEFGIGEGTLRKAFQDIGGKTKKQGMSGGWEWNLPKDDSF